MRKIISVITTVSLSFATAYAQNDTLWLSTAFTTHVIFSTELTYADLSNSSLVAAKIIEQNRNMLALKARQPFTEAASVSALEANGRMHTYIIRYCPNPSELVIDTRSESEKIGTSVPAAGDGRSVSLTRKGDAPLLSDAVNARRRLFHLGARKYDITFQCEDIISYSDMTYIVLSLHNGSGVSYEAEDATFVIESKRRGRRSVIMEKTIFPKNRYGSLSAATGQSTKMAYSFEKMTLSREQVMKIYLYESSGQRNLEITVDTDDINRSKANRRRQN